MENHDSFEQDLKMLQYFQNEFEYRHKHYWHILERFFLVFIVIVTLPILKGVFGIEFTGEKVGNVLYLFPLIAIFVAIIQFLVLIDEAKKLNAVNRAKYRLNKKHMDERYRYWFYSDEEKAQKEEKKKQAEIKRAEKKARKAKKPPKTKKQKKTGKDKNKDGETNSEPLLRKWLAIRIPFLIFAFQIIVAVSVAMMI